MEPIPCVNCGVFFIPRNSRQNYCTQPGCQRSRKAAWQRYKMKHDGDYRTQQRISQQKWLQANPSYYRLYRRRNPDKASRNQALQTIRNRRNRQRLSSQKLTNHALIAKMDVSKVNIYAISNSYL